MGDVSPPALLQQVNGLVADWLMDLLAAPMPMPKGGAAATADGKALAVKVRTWL